MPHIQFQALEPNLQLPGPEALIRTKPGFWGLGEGILTGILSSLAPLSPQAVSFSLGGALPVPECPL